MRNQYKIFKYGIGVALAAALLGGTAGFVAADGGGGVTTEAVSLT